MLWLSISLTVGEKNVCKPGFRRKKKYVVGMYCFCFNLSSLFSQTSFMSLKCGFVKLIYPVIILWVVAAPHCLSTLGRPIFLLSLLLPISFCPQIRYLYKHHLFTTTSNTPKIPSHHHKYLYNPINPLPTFTVITTITSLRNTHPTNKITL